MDGCSRQLCHDGLKHLPLPTGRYVVGCTDIMTESSIELQSQDCDEQQKPTGTSEYGCFVRLFYPAEGDDDILKYSNQWPTWLPDPMYTDGYADFIHINASLFRPLFKLLSGTVHIPVIWNAQVNRHISKCPVVVYSHGLGGCRTAYSTICSELASYGFVVAAVEHRDRSSCITYDLVDVNRTVKDEREATESKVADQPNDKIDVGDTMDSTKIFPRSLTQRWIRYLTAEKDQDLHQLRNPQVHERGEECLRLLDVLESLNKGEFVDNLLDNSIALNSFVDFMDLSKAAMVGHSFGGATVLRTLGVEKNRFKVGVCLDVYMLPVEKEIDLLKSIQQPLLFVNTETFHSSNSLKIMKSLQESDHERNIFTIRGTVHQSQSDSPFVTGTIARRLFGSHSNLDRFDAMATNNGLLLEFLWKHLDLKPDDRVVNYLKGQENVLIKGIL